MDCDNNNNNNNNNNMNNTFGNHDNNNTNSYQQQQQQQSVMEWSECTQNVTLDSTTTTQREHVAAAPTIKNHSVTHFNGYLYCFGGYDGRRNHMTLLLYSIAQQRWIRPYHVGGTTSTSTSTSTTMIPIPNGTGTTTTTATATATATAIATTGTSTSTVVTSTSTNHLNNTTNSSAADLFRLNSSTAAAAAAGTSSDPSIVVQGTPPPGRNGHSATLAITDPDDDEDQGRIIIIGGWLGTGPLAAADMHVLDITFVNHHHHQNHHTMSSSHSMLLDNNNNNNNHHNDANGNNNNTAGCRQLLQWYQPAVKGTPPGPCNMHSADYVAARKEVYVFRGGNGREYLNDLHALHVQTLSWRKVECTGAIPQQRANHSSAILEETAELFIFGGWNGTERLNDIHILDTETSNWTCPHVGGVLPNPRAGMTLTALRGRLYLFGGSGTSAKCFQDLQILDRHEMAWLDVVADNENNNNNNNNNGSSSAGGSPVNHHHHHHHQYHHHPYDPDPNRFQFGGSKIYGGHHPFDHSSSTASYLTSAGIHNNYAEIEARPQQGGTQEDSFLGSPYNNASSSMLSSDIGGSNTDWRSARDPRQRRGVPVGCGPLHHQYSSPNPNDEDTVPSVLIRGHGPGRRAGHTATAVNRKIFVFGGSCGSDYLNDFFVLDTDPPPSAIVTEANPLLLMERRLRHFFNDPEFADVVFVVGEDGHKVYGHKMVLSIVSDCFRAMFTTGFRESAAMEIEIPDCSHAAFLAVMEYIYTGNLPAHSVLIQHHHHHPMDLSPVVNNHPVVAAAAAGGGGGGMNPYDPTQSSSSSSLQAGAAAAPQVHTQNLTRVVEMLELADRFFLDHLKQICETMLQSAVQAETVEYLLSVSQKTNSTQLQSICEHFMRNHYTGTTMNNYYNNPRQQENAQAAATANAVANAALL